MGVRYPSVQSNTILNSPLVNAADTVIVTTPPLTLPLDSAVVLLLWYVVITFGATTNGYFARLRRGTAVASPQINAANTAVVAAAGVVEASGWYFDTPGAAAGVQYSLSFVAQAATANSAIQDVALLAFAL